MRYKVIIIEAGWTQEDLEEKGAAYSCTYLSVADAKQRAKYLLTKAYADLAEMSEPFGYSRVMVSPRTNAPLECVADYVRK